MVAAFSNQLAEELICPQPGDDPGVRTAAAALLNWMQTIDGVERIIAVRIDTWFDEKWLGFSHKALGAFGVRNSLACERLVVPPFVSNRVVAQREVAVAGGTWRVTTTKPMAREQASASNRNRWFEAEYPSSAALWMSSDSALSGRCSLMVYHPTERGVTGWYAEINAGHDWHPRRTAGITPDMLRSLLGRTAKE